MRDVILLPLVFLKFWFWEAPISIVKFFGSLNRSFLQLLSLPLLLKTYFKPWKNEYRKGLIGFSIGMGMFIKTFVIFIDLILLLIFVVLEIVSLFLFLLWPIATIYMISTSLSLVF